MVTDAGTLNVPIGKVMDRVTLDVNITGLRRLRFRLWLAACLLQCGAALIGCRIHIHERPEVIE
jgi:hypothetical protein